ncbi:MAG: M48 family metallopeptidase, partial [Mariprofundaceae bacterium]
MDFFGQQEQARKHTTWLVLIFAAAVVTIILAVYLAVVSGLFFAQFFQGQQSYFTVETLWDPQLFAWTTGIALLMVGSGSLYRTLQLKKGGGAAVAEMLGGERVPSATSDPLVRRMLNITEEMAIASGVPVPPVYLLQQSGINAFAAGFSSSDAVIAVTRGALELLNRDELQGVIAHEFSHILNGDTRLKMRLMGLLFGITLISDAGILLMTSRHSVRYSISRRERGVHPALLIIGMLLFLVGTIGAVFADMIKRAVSRQREFLADAAAVQFTRNPLGIANALKVIGGYKEGSRIRHAGAEQASHFFFGNARQSWRTKDWWATHPPLSERIRRLDPSFKGDIPKIQPQVVSSRVYNEAAAAFDAGSGAQTEHLKASVDHIMHGVGSPAPVHLAEARRLLGKIPTRVKDFAHDPYTARAAVYVLLLHADAKARAMQLKALEQAADPDVYREVLEVQPEMQHLDAELRLPLLEMLLPTLKTLSKPQYLTFRKAVQSVIKSDGKVSIFEYMLHRMLMRHLKPAFATIRPLPVKYDQVQQVSGDCACVLVCLLAYGAHADRAGVLARAAEYLGIQLEPPAAFKCKLGRLDVALKRLELAAPEVKKRLLT